MPDNSPVGYTLVGNGKATTLSVVLDEIFLLTPDDPTFAETRDLLIGSDTSDPDVRRRLEALVRGNRILDTPEAQEIALDPQVRITAGGELEVYGRPFAVGSLASLLIDSVSEEGSEGPHSRALLRIVQTLADVDPELADHLWSWVSNNDVPITDSGELIVQTWLVGHPGGNGTFGIGMHNDAHGRLVIDVERGRLADDDTGINRVLAWAILDPSDVVTVGQSLEVTRVRVIASVPIDRNGVYPVAVPTAYGQVIDTSGNNITMS